jgi:hypothetical protein
MRWVALLVFPCFSGCLAVGYPATCQTPAIEVNFPDTRAFRVTSDLRQSGSWNGSPSITGRVEEIPIVAEPNAGIRVPEQKDSYFAYSYRLFPFAEGCHDHSLRVLLYRPGYETVAVDERGWSLMGTSQPISVVWREAKDLAAQERALERVVARRPISWSVFEPGVLRFVAQEYTRLANGPLAAGPEKQKTRERLLARAQECEKAAGQVEKARTAEGQGNVAKTTSTSAPTSARIE